MHLYLLTKFSNRFVNVSCGFNALHLYLLTRFSNTTLRLIDCCLLCTFIYLQGSQTLRLCIFFRIGFAPLFTYKVLKPRSAFLSAGKSFAPLFTYKVLKHAGRWVCRIQRFAPLFTYKVLKPQIFFQGHHRTHNILAYVQAFSLYQRKTFSKLVMLICNNAIVIVKNIQFFTISFVIYTEFYQH